MIAHAIQGRDIERNGTVLQLSTLVTPLVYPCADGEVVPHRHQRRRSCGLMPWMVESGAVTAGVGRRRGLGRPTRRGCSPSEPLVHSARGDARGRSSSSRRRHTKAELFEGGIARGVTLAPVNTVADVLPLEQLARPRLLGRRRRCRAAARCAARARSSRRRPRRWRGPARRRSRRAHRRGAGRARPRRRRPRRLPAPASSPRPSRRACRWRASRSPTSRGSASGRSRPRRSPTTAPPSCTSRATGRPTACASSARSRTTSPASTAASSSAAFNTSKLSLQLNLKHPEGHRRSPGGCSRGATSPSTRSPPARWASLGLGYDVARELNPSIIMATTCLLGQTGPAAQPRRLRLPRRRRQRVLRDHRVGRPPAGRAVQRVHRHRRAAVPDHHAAGRARPPPPHRRGPVHRPGADGVGAALPRPASCSTCRCPGTSARRAGNHDPAARPHDAYPCAGHDEWCAIAVEDRRAVARRCATVLGEPAWATDPALDTAAGRRERHRR